MCQFRFIRKKAVLTAFFIEETNVQYLLYRLCRLLLLCRNAQDQVADRFFFTVGNDDDFQDGLQLELTPEKVYHWTCIAMESPVG